MTLNLICCCETSCADEDGNYTILRVWGKTAKCHTVGDTITAAEAAHIRRVYAEWDRAEREWLEQPL